MQRNPHSSCRQVWARLLLPCLVMLLGSAGFVELAQADRFGGISDRELPTGKTPSGEAEGVRAEAVESAGNEVYTVYVADFDQSTCGTWTARTGIRHEAGSGLNVLFGNGRPGTSDTTLRSYSSGRSYRTGSRQGCERLCQVALPSLVNIFTNGVHTGFRMTWEFEDQEDQFIEFIQEVNVEGPVDGSETVDNTTIRETHIIRNLGDGELSYGLRKHWDWQIGPDDGPWFGDCETPTVACDRSVNLSEDGSMDGPYPGAYTINPDPASAGCAGGLSPNEPAGCSGDPLYIVAGTVRAAADLDPPADPPEVLQFNSWPNVVGSCWNSDLDDRALCGAMGSPSDDTTIAYFYGLTPSSALKLPPGADRSLTQYVTAASEECPEVLSPPLLSCSAGGPYFSDCQGQVTSVQLDGEGGSDSGDVAFSWTSDCPNASFDDPTFEDPLLTFDTLGCVSDCTVTLTVSADGESKSCESTVRVEDLSAPEIDCPPEPLELDCIEGGISRTDARVQDWLASARAFDQCEQSLKPVEDEFPEFLFFESCPTIRSILFFSTDDCGNSSSCVQDVILIDETDPVVSCPDDLSSPCDEPADKDAWLASATAADDCAGELAVSSTQVSLEEPCPHSQIEVWSFSARDDCGNEHECTARFAVEDLVGPRITPPADKTVDCGTDPADLETWLATATASDDCAGDVSVSHELTSTEEPCAGTSIRTYTFRATDACGNSSEASARYSLTDETAPTLSDRPNDADVPCDAVPGPATLTATDDCDPSPSVSFTEEREDGDCPNTYTLTRTWTATDDCGNASTHTQRLSVSDREAPTLSGVPADASVSCDSVPAPATPSAADSCDPDVDIRFEERRDDGDCPGSYTLTRTWTASDACGNATSSSQVITVADLESPTLAGVPADVDAACDAVPEPATPSAMDNCDPDVDITFVETRTEGDCPNSYTLTRTWTATDDCGNTTESSQRLVVTDTVEPTITGVPDDSVASCDAVPPPASPDATDNCGVPSLEMSEERRDGDCPGRYTLTRTWTATDLCGNASEAVQVITVRDDEPPVLTGVPDDSRVACDAVPAPARPTATDNCGESSIEFEEIRTDGSCPSNYRLDRTWTATDSCGNSVSETQTITVEDTEGPTLAGIPRDATADCDEIPEPADVTAVDNCGVASVSFVEEQLSTACADEQVLRRTWTAVDECENATRATQLISVVDETPPTVMAALLPRSAAPASSTTSVSSRAPSLPRTPASARSSVSAPTSGLFEVACSASDNCDPDPLVEAQLLVTRHAYLADGECVELLDIIPVACGEVLELRLEAPPCPPRPASSGRSAGSAATPVAPGPALEVSSNGDRVVTGERIVLSVVATDRCGNTNTSEFDPRDAGDGECEEPLVDGSCPPLLAQPGGGCEPPCATDEGDLSSSRSRATPPRQERGRGMPKSGRSFRDGVRRFGSAVPY